jgi:hypothetical protein
MELGALVDVDAVENVQKHTKSQKNKIVCPQIQKPK